MNNFWMLVRTNILVFWGSLKNRKKGRYAASGTLMAILILFFGGIMAFQATVQTFALTQEGIPELAIFMSLMSALALGVLFGLMRSANAPGSRDAEMLLSMPISRVTVVCSKVITHYIFDAPLMILIFVPTVISYFVIGGGTVGELCRGLLLAFLLPLLPMSLSYLVGAVLGFLQKRFKLTGIITTGLLMLLLVGYMYVNFQTTSIFANVTALGRNEALGLIEKFAPLSWLTHFVLDGSVFPVLFSLMMLIGPFCIGLWIYALNFGKPKLNYHSTSQILSFELRSPRMALLDKEVKRYLACSIYVFNTAFGPVLLLIAAIALAVVGPDAMIAGMQLPSELSISKDTTLVVVAAIFCFFPSVTSTSASSISLEGSQLWILKAHPIRTEDIFWAKYMLNVIILVPAAWVASVIIGVRMQMSPLELMGFAVVITLLGFLVSLLGLVINLLFPRFDWTSETAVVKQSMSVMMAMLAGFIVAGTPFVLYFVFFSGYTGFLGFCAVGIIIYGILVTGLHFFLKTKGKKLFDAL